MRIQEKIKTWEVAAVLALLSAAAPVFTWPLAARMSTSVPLASEPRAVAWFQVFSCRWTALALQQGWQHYWHPGFFYPLPGVFAWCEPQLLNCLLAAAFGLLPGCAGVCGYNLMLFFNMVLLGLTGYLLARRLTADRIAASLCGLWLCCGAFSLQQLCAPAVLAGGWPLLVIFALVSGVQQPKFSCIVLGACAYCAAWFTSKQTAVFLTVLFPVMLTALVPDRRKALRAAGLAAAGMAAVAVFVFPYTLAQYRLASALGFERARDAVWTISDWRQLFMPAAGHWLIGRLLAVSLYSWSLGVVMVVLMTAASASGWLKALRADASRARTAAALGSIACVSLVIAAAGRLLSGDLMRTPERAAFFAIAAAAVLGASAFAWLRSRIASVPVRRLFSAGVFLLLAAEMWTMPVRLAEPEQEVIRRQPAIDYLRTHERHIPVLELPLRQHSADREASAMLAMLEHTHPLINGYASFMPASYRAFKDAWTTRPLEDGLHLLLAYRPVYVLAMPGECRPEEVRALRQAAAEGTVAIDNASILLFRIPPAAGKKSD